ncbi:MAG: hypothetical protein AABX61_03295 [Nanoarchaeota archaeon]
MKKLIILLIILLPIVNAQDVSISLLKNNYNQYETLQAEVMFNLSLSDKITASNFALTDRENRTIPITLFLEKISDLHYFAYFDIPEIENNTYRFLVKDVKYLDNNILKKISYYKEFYLHNQKSISIYPAILNNVNRTILKIINHGEKTNITIKADEINLSKQFLLENNLNLDLDIPKNINNFNIRLEYLNNKFYLIPVIPYTENITLNESKPLQIPKENILLLNSTFGDYFNDKLILQKNLTREGPFYLENNLDYKIYNIEFILSDNLKDIVRLNLSNIKEVNPKETIKQYIWINENKNPKKLKYSGDIEVRVDQDIIKIIPLEIQFREEYKKEINETKEVIINTTKNKNITQQNQSKQIPNVEGKNNLGFIVILVVIIIIGILLYFIFKGPNNKSDYEKFLKD